MKQREAKIPALYKNDLAESADRIIRLYEAMGRAEQARTWRQQHPPDPAEAAAGPGRKASSSNAGDGPAKRPATKPR